MSNQDNVVINVRERPLSSDINNLESLAARSFAESMLYEMASVDTNTGAALIRNVVLGGLAVIPNGSNVDVTAGVLFQYSASLTPVPGSYDSAYRYGRNGASTAVTMAAPASTTYYLIEAQVSLVTTVTSSRDILDPGTGTFLPALVPKVQESQVVFQVVAGTAGGAVPTPTGGDWVPLAVVKRPPGGGVVAQADISDVRPVWSNTTHNRNAAQGGAYMVATPVFTEGNTAVINTVTPAQVSSAGELFVSLASIDLTSAAVIEPGLVVAASTAYNLYLCEWNGLTPCRAGFNTDSVAQRGVLVLTDVDPIFSPYATAEAASSIDLPAPWSATAPGYRCAYVGSVYRNAGNTGWAGQYPNGVRSTAFAPIGTLIGTIPSGAAPQGFNFDFSTVIPPTALSAVIRVYATTTTLTGSSFRVMNTAATVVYEDVSFPTDTATGVASVELRVPLISSGSTVRIQRDTGTAGSGQPVYLVSWSY